MSDYFEALERARRVRDMRVRAFRLWLVVLVAVWFVPEFLVGLATPHCSVFRDRAGALWAFPGTALACRARGR